MFVRKLTICRYRGIDQLEWYPSPGLNCLTGPGDSGKTTILGAVSLLLSPNPSPQVSEYDYFKRRVKEGFEITAVLGGVNESFRSAMRIPALWGWKDGSLFPLPDEDGAAAVLHVRVVGTAELEAKHEILVPSGEPLYFSAALRQKVLMSRVSGEERALRETRLGPGSLLGRHFDKVDLRSSMSSALATASSTLELPDEAKDQLETIGRLFANAGLPSELHLGLVAPLGAPLLGMMGLLAGKDPAEAIPVAFAGAGTRQASLFALTVALMGEGPVVVLDEPESGLEPYRQRAMVSQLRDVVRAQGQAFLTTHAPAVIESLRRGEIWRFVRNQNPVRIDNPLIERVTRRAPDALLSRLPVLCEGDTEAGLLGPMLGNLTEAANVAPIDALGIRLIAREGQPSALEEAGALLDLGIRCGLFVDAEEKYSGTRAKLASRQECAFGSWTGVRNIEEAIATWLPIEKLEELITATAVARQTSAQSLLQQVCQRAGKPGKYTLEELRNELSEQDVRSALARAMLEGGWYKREEYGAFLGRKLLEFGLPSELKETFESFWSRLLALLQ